MLYICYALGFLSALFVAGLFGLSWMLQKGVTPTASGARSMRSPTTTLKTCGGTMFSYDDATAGVFLDPAEVLAAFSVAHGWNEDQYTFSVSHVKADGTHVRGRYCRFVWLTGNGKVRVFDINKGAYRIIDPERVTDLKRMKVKSVPVTEEELSQYI